MKAVSEEFLKFNKIHCDKRKQVWYAKAQLFKDYLCYKTIFCSKVALNV